MIITNTDEAMYVVFFFLHTLEYPSDVTTLT